MVLTADLLEKYFNIEKEINRINRKLDYYSRNPVASAHGVVSGSLKRFPYTGCHFVVGGADVKSSEERDKKVNQLIITLAEKKSEYENLQIDIDIAIEELEDIEMRQILQFKYIDRMTDFEIGRELGYERSTISKKLSIFFSKSNDSHKSHFEYATMGIVK